VTSIDTQRIREKLRDRATVNVTEFCDTIGNLFAEVEKKSYWADKTPDYGFFMQQIQTLWPRCKFIHVIRNGFAVARSMSKHLGYRWLVSASEATWCSVSYNSYYKQLKEKHLPLQNYVTRWYKSLVRIRDESKRLDNGSYMEVRFEDLLQNPREMLEEVAAFLCLKQPSAWITQAIDTIDFSKLNRPMRHDMIDTLGDNELKLLQDLQYV